MTDDQIEALLVMLMFCSCICTAVAIICALA